jgi:hypothetical protein
MAKIFLFLIKLLFFILFFTNCIDKKNKDNYMFSKQICENWYEVHYEVYLGGVFGHDVYNCFITDSIKVDYFINSYDEEEGYELSCKSDTIIIKKLDCKGKAKVIETSYLSKKQLIKEFSNSPKIKKSNNKK